jgi:hypothetical protein
MRMCAEQTYPFCIQPKYLILSTTGYKKLLFSKVRLFQTTRYTSSQKNPDQIRRIFLKQEKLNVANVNKEKHGGNYEIGI